jgi:hypothetical protein
LFFTRLAAKTDLVSSVIDQTNNLSEVSNGSVTEVVLIACDVGLLSVLSVEDPGNANQPDGLFRHDPSWRVFRPFQIASLHLSAHVPQKASSKWVAFTKN